MSVIYPEKKVLVGFQVRDENNKWLTYSFITNEWIKKDIMNETKN